MILSDDEVLHAWDDDPTWFRPKFKASHLEANARIRELEAKLQELEDAAQKAINLYAEAVIRSIDILERADRAEAKVRELVEAAEWRDECDEARRYCFWRREDYSRTSKHWHRWGESLWHAIQLLDEAEAAYQAALKAAKEG